MKIVKITKQEIIEEVPFDWKELKKDLEDADWFDPEDPDGWNKMIDWLENKYTDEELDEHRDKIIQYMKDRRKDELDDELYWILRGISDIPDSIYNITEEDVHNYITNWFKENK